MKPEDGKLSIAARLYDAWLFDMDGVVTDTAALHADAWEKMFNEFLKKKEASTGKTYAPFSMKPDYYVHLDGRLRYEGVDSFLQSRGIALEWGDPDDGCGRETICALGNQKNALFNEILANQGAVVYDTTIELIQELCRLGKSIGIVTSSENCSAMLASYNLTGFFSAQVDALVAAELGLPGKPQSAMYLEAARRLDVAPARTVIVEDAISGVQAGKSGNFGLVIGVARKDEAKQLRHHGADIVCQDLGSITLSG